MKKMLFFLFSILISISSFAQVDIQIGNGSNQSDLNTINYSPPCSSITFFPWNEGFESAWTASAVAPGNAVGPDCWLNMNGGSSTATYLWRRTTGTAAYIRTGSAAAQHYTSATAVTNDYLITPMVTLTGNERLRFYVKGYSTYVDHFRVAIYDVNQVGQDIASINDTTLFATIIPHSFVPSTDWNEYIINLNNYVGNFRIAFIRDLVGGYYLNLDDVTIETIPSCPQPVSSTFTVDTTSASINWVPANPSQTTFYLYYKLATATNYDSVIVNTNTYTLQNLISGSTYNYYIKVDCGTEFSAPTPVKTFKTLCSVITALPVSDSFDTYGTGTTTYPTCWMRLGTNAGNPYISSTNASSPGSLYFNVGYQYGYSIAISPKIDASIPINTIKATLKFRATGLDDTLYVGVMNDPYDITTFQQVGFITATVAAVFQDKEFFFTNYSGTGQFIAIKAAYSATSSTVYVDNVVLDLIPSCANPTSLTASNVTHNQINLGWLENGTATSWNIEYGPTGFAHGAGTLLTGVTANPYLITGLTPQTTFQFYVQADCGGTLSPWSSPITVTTACSPITLIPYAETFDTYGTGTGTFPTCWTKFGSSTTYPYISSTSYAGAGSLYLYNSASGNYNYAILPAFDAAIPVNTLQMEFKFRASGVDDTLYVGVMSDPSNIATFTVVSTYTVPVTATFYDITTYFGSFTGNGSNIVFKSSYGISSSTIYVDNVLVSAIPACPAPSNVSATNVTATELNLQWTENGTATTWNVEYGPTGFTPGTGTILTGVTTNPLSITNLTAQTQYQFYIQSDCGAGTTSSWTSPYTITTACSEIVTLPWTDFFDTYGSGTSVFPPCWTRNTTYADRPYVNSTSFAGSGSLYFYAGTAGTYNIAATPIFSTQIQLNTLMATFKYRTTNSTDTLYVGVMTDPAIASTFETVAVLTNSATTVWDDEMVFFAPYTGTGRYIAFKIQHNGTADYAYIDNLTIQTAPTCIMPTQLFSSTPTSTSINLNWTELGTSTSWNIEYGSVGFIQGTGTLLSNVTTNPYTISGLNPQTAYQFYIQSNCATETSAWSTPLIAMTGCGNITQLPYYEYFEYYGTGTGTFPTCWTKITSNATYPYISTTNFSSPGALYLYCSAAGAYNYAVSPQIDITQPINTLRIEFKFRASGTDDTLYVGVMSSPTDTATFELVSQFSVPTISVFDDYSVNFNSYTGTGQYIAFKSKYGTTSSTIYIDNFQLMPIPSCARPVDLGVTNVTDVSAQLFWTEDGTATTWKVEYGPTGFIPGTGTILNGLTDTTVLVSGLTAQTTYQFYAYADCGGGNISLASNVFTFTTSCTPLLTIPFIENFDTYGTSTTTFPTCWRKLSSYIVTSYPYLSTTNFSSPASMYFYSGVAGSYNIVIAPTIDFTIPMNTLRASFKYRVSGADDTLYVGIISNINDPNSFETISKITSSSTATWLDGEVFYTNYAGSGRNIAFKNSYGITSSTIYVDNVVIDLIPSCPKPTSLTATAIQTNSFNLGFTENGSATTWNIEYGPVGFLPGTGTGTSISAITSNPYNVTGLTPQTTYQFYVQSVCSSTDFSLWSNPITITTACASITTLPWTDYFDTYGTGSTIFPTCWTRNTTYADRPYVGTTNVTAPGGLYFYVGTSGTYNIAATPMFDPSIQINTLSATFKYRSYYITDTMYVGVMTDPFDASTFVLVDKVGTTSTGVFFDKEVFFSNYSGTGHYIAFKIQYQGSSTSYGYMDNLEIGLIPTCPKPTYLTASNITTNSANLSWTENGTATSWNIEYGPTGFTQGSGTSIIAATNPISLVALNNSTCYDFYVQAVCSPTDLSLWSSKGTFCTSQVPVNVPVSIDFETPSGIQFVNNATGNSWYTGTDTAHTVNNTTGGLNALYVSNDNGLTNAFTITTSMVVWAYRDIYFTPSTSDYTFSFNWKGQGEGTTTAYDYLSVYIGNPVLPVASTSTTITPPTGSDTIVTKLRLQPTWQTATFNLPYASLSGQTKRIYFMWRNDGSGGTQPPAAVDNISITSAGIGTCLPPTNVNVTAISTTSATISWTAGGTETEWEVDYKPTSASTWNTVLVATNPTTTINTLSASTQYEVRVRAKCSPTSYSTYTTITNFTTPANPCFAPSNLAASNITDNAATITWTPGGTETSWQVEYKISTSSNWTIPAAVTVPTIYIQGLQNNTTYDVRVKSICNPGESSFTSTQFTTTGGVVTFTINATASGPGTITPNGAVSVLSGANQMFTFTPNTGCEVSTLLVDNISVPNPGLTYNFSNVTTTHTIHVTFGTIGILESEMNQWVELYPNPTSSYIDIKVKDDHLLILETKLFDMYGKLIQIVKLQENNARIDVSHLSTGVYFIKMDSAKGTITKKFIKK